jgi:4-amino-4-deoxy-L-arabinose transferase-like glycosyltransferase
MSTAPRKKKPAAARASGSAPWLTDNRQRALVAIALVVFAGIPFVLGKYFELKYPDPFDSGSYVYSAQHVLSGARVGYEEKPSAQAGTLLVNVIGVKLSGYNEIGSKVLQGLFQAAAMIFIFFAVRRLYGSLAAVISVIVASVYLSAPVIAKFGNVKEQFMIALMIMGICSFVWYHLSGKRWWALLTGALLVGGPMFKQTGVSAIAAVGLFTLAQPLLHRYGWKKVGIDLVLLIAGAAITLTPICLWYASMDTPLYYWPYSFALAPVFKMAGVEMEYVADTGQEPARSRVEGVSPSDRGQDARGTKGDSLILKLLPAYVSESWRLLGPDERAEALRRVFRYYGVLILPIALALGAIVARIAVLLRHRRTKAEAKTMENPGRFVLLFAIWWFLDMSFCIISPHSYEQYYLPLNASSAVLGGYFVGLYAYRFRTDRDKTRWTVLGLLGLIAMIVMSWHIFFGLTRWPYNGAPAVDGAGRPMRIKGYRQKWQEIAENGKGAWAVIGDHIRANSQSTDTMYVWGWFPGIYVQAQRMSPTPKAFEGMMHMLPPEQLAERVQEILHAFEKNPPKFIVDTRKRHFPLTRPPLELWPRTEQGFLPPQEETMRQFDRVYAGLLKERVDPVEALRYEVMQPFRRYVMTNYRVVQDVGGQVLFQRK